MINDDIVAIKDNILNTVVNTSKEIIIFDSQAFVLIS